jgi:hypothetical protein
MRNFVIGLPILLILSSCITSEKVINNLHIELNNRFNTVFFDKAINAMDINLNKVDTLFVLERYHDLIWNYDRGVVWTSNGFVEYFTLSTPKKYKYGIPYRECNGINILKGDSVSDFNLEMELLSKWDIEKIREIDFNRAIITDGTIIAVRIIRNKRRYLGEYVFFGDLRDYPTSLKY